MCTQKCGIDCTQDVEYITSFHLVVHPVSINSVGEGSFGRVLQAKAEGIVPGMPERNIVAIKTTKGNFELSTL